MQDHDVFRTPCWNFVGGDREIEGILRDLPADSGVVVRNRLAHVLPTVAALADLATLGAGRCRVSVPDNAVLEPALDRDRVIAPEALWEHLLTRLYGVRTAGLEAVLPPGGVVLAVGYGDGHDAPAAAFAAWLGRQPDARLVLVAPRGVAIPAVLRPFAASAWSGQHAETLNALAVPGVEEAIAEALAELPPDQQVVAVASPDIDALAYSAIGVADAFIRARAMAGRRPDAREAGAGVTALLGLVPAASGGAPAALGALIRAHLAGRLGVVSTAADGRFRATGEAIALDLL